MKKLTFLLFIPLFCATTCDDDPCENNVKYITNHDLIKVEENETIYNIGDTLWLNTTVSRIQMLQNGQSTYDLFNENQTFAYYLSMFKNSNLGNDYQVYLSSENLISIKGNAESNYFTLVKENDNFVNRTGIKLVESGSFNINVSDISSYGSGGCNFSTQIQTKILNSDEYGNYNFNVQ